MVKVTVTYPGLCFLGRFIGVAVPSDVNSMEVSFVGTME